MLILKKIREREKEREREQRKINPKRVKYVTNEQVAKKEKKKKERNSLNLH